MVVHPILNWTDFPLAPAMKSGLFTYRKDDGTPEFCMSVMHWILAEGFRGTPSIRALILNMPSPKEAYSLALKFGDYLDASYVERLPSILTCGLLFQLDQLPGLANEVSLPSRVSNALRRPFLGRVDLLGVYEAVVARLIDRKASGYVVAGVVGQKDLDSLQVREGLDKAFCRVRPDYVVLGGPRYLELKVEAWARARYIPTKLCHDAGRGKSNNLGHRVECLVSMCTHLLQLGKATPGFVALAVEKAKSNGLIVRQVQRLSAPALT